MNTAYKSRNGTEKADALRAALAKENLRRCLFGVAFFAFFTPVALLVLAQEDAGEGNAYLLLGIFFTISCAAFAYLIFCVLKKKTKSCYAVVSYVCMAFLSAFLCCFAQIEYRTNGQLFLYCATVLLGGYLLYLELRPYLLCSLLELAALAVIVVSAGTDGLTAFQVMELCAVHLFAFLVSRETYGRQLRLVKGEQKVRREEQNAEHDFLTGLYNRRGLERAVEAVWARCVQRREPVAVLLADIDGFKEYNDRFGHVQGDDCLRRVAGCLGAAVRGLGCVSRIGGEEFLVFLHGRTEDEVFALAERLCREIEGLRIPAGDAPGQYVTVSIGVDIGTADEDLSFVGLYERADRQLYRAKRGGRNRVAGNETPLRRRRGIG